MRSLSTVCAALAASVLILAGCTDPAEQQDSPSPPPQTEPEPTEPEPTEPQESDTPEETADPEPEAVLDEFGVSAAHPAAVQAGSRTLEAGGSAADAVVAAAFAVAVVEPFASGIGGGGAAIVVPADAQAQAYDYREVVPNSGVIPAGGVGVPGFVAGMARLHADHGRLDWDQVLTPAIELAADGFEVSDFLALRMASDRGPDAIGTQQQFAPGGAPLAAGQRLVQADLAGTMRTIAQDGPDSFYTGALASSLASVDGLDAQSLADYEVVVAEPVSGQVGDYHLLSAPPALPGVALIQLLQVAQGAGLADAAPGSPAFIESIGQGWRSAQETANTVLGDPAFVDVPIDSLTGASHAVGPSRGGSSAASTLRGPAHAGNTTHLTVVDTDGLMISMTNTITSFWGSQRYLDGYFLNDQLTRFDAIGTTAANQPEAGKRSVSWSLPSVLVDGDGRAVLGLGSPGGERIPQLLSGVIARWALHGQSLQDAVAADRFAYESGELLLESEPSSEVASGLSGGYRVVPASWAYFGSVQALEVDFENGTVSGAIDRRREADLHIGRP